jgi:hypothetical protein
MDIKNDWSHCPGCGEKIISSGEDTDTHNAGVWKLIKYSSTGLYYVIKCFILLTIFSVVGKVLMVILPIVLFTLFNDIKDERISKDIIAASNIISFICAYFIAKRAYSEWNKGELKRK